MLFSVTDRPRPPVKERKTHVALKEKGWGYPGLNFLHASANLHALLSALNLLSSFLRPEPLQSMNFPHELQFRRCSGESKHALLRCYSTDHVC